MDVFYPTRESHPIFASHITNLGLDLTSLISSYLSQSEIERSFRLVCKYWNQCAKNVTNKKYFRFANPRQSPFLNLQTTLEGLAAYGVKDIQHYLSSLPRYTFFGNGSSFHPLQFYRGFDIHQYALESGSSEKCDVPVYQTELLFLEKGSSATIDGRSFPWLKTLIILSNDVSLHNLEFLQNLEVLLVGSDVMIDASIVCALPKIKIFVVTTLESKACHLPSPSLKYVANFRDKACLFPNGYTGDYVDICMWAISSSGRPYSKSSEELLETFFRPFLTKYHTIPPMMVESIR
jgi:hypothetical protein